MKPQDGDKRSERLLVMVEPVAVNSDGAGRMFGVSGRTWQTRASAGLTPAPIHLGSEETKNIWLVETLRDWGAAGCPSRDRWEALQGNAGAREKWSVAEPVALPEVAGRPQRSRRPETP